jgi:hypothetical protein
MSGTKNDVIVVAFPSTVEAKKAVDDLYYADFRPEQLGIIAPDGSRRDGTTDTSLLEDRATQGSVVGAATGALVGVGLGALAVVAVPAFGAIVAGGIASALLGSAALGASLGGLLGTFVSLGLSEDDAQFYAGKFEKGNPIVIVRPEGRAEEAWEILHRHDAHVAPAKAARV